MSCITFWGARTTYMILCLGWYKTCRRSQGFSTHNLNSWAFRSALVVVNCVIVVLLYCSLLFLFIMLYPYHCLMSQSLVIIAVHPLSTNLVTLGNPCLMLMDCLVLSSLLVKGALKHHTYDDFKQHKRGILQN